jgi:peroxiredoxin
MTQPVLQFLRAARGILGRHLPLFVLGASVAANLILANRLLQANQPASTNLPVGTVVEPFSAVSPRGDTVVVDYQSGVPTVLYYFSPSCGWCERNWANVETLAEQTKSRYRFIAVSSADVSAEFIRDRHVAFEVVSNVPQDVIARYGFHGTPQTLVISQDRRVLRAWTGAYTSLQATEVEAYFGMRLPGLAKPAGPRPRP